jgi:hypothetical protein
MILELDNIDSTLEKVHSLLDEKYSDLFLKGCHDIDDFVGGIKSDSTYLSRRFFSSKEWDEIMNILNKLSVRLYHGCLIDDFEKYKKSGLRSLKSVEIEESLLELASKDPELKKYLPEIKRSIEDGGKARSADGLVSFSASAEKLLEYDNYIRYGSEYRARILDDVNINLKKQLLKYGTPSILVFEIPINMIRGTIKYSLVEDWCKSILDKNNMHNNLSFNYYNGEHQVIAPVPFNFYTRIIYPRSI